MRIERYLGKRGTRVETREQTREYNAIIITFLLVSYFLNFSRPIENITRFLREREGEREIPLCNPLVLSLLFC